jgi:outer membrane protein assembly factor BamA
MKRTIFMVLAFLSLVRSFDAHATDEVKVVPASGARSDREISIPYGFYNDSFGAAVGYVYSIVGAPQPQSALMATAMAGTKGSAMLFLMGRDIRVFGVERLFMDPIVSTGYFVDNNAYINGNPAFVGQRAGSNDSDKNNYVTGSGWDNFFRITFKYLLPIGNGADQVVNAYRLKGGLLTSGATGGRSWNPLESGQTFLQVRPFYRSQEISSDFVDSVQRTNGLDFSIYWDNRDFPVNPSLGNSLLLKVSRDFGWANSSNPWTVYAAELDKYFSLGPSDTFRQRVLAFDIWTAYSPSWEVQPNGTITNRPPTYAGATLGGLWRLRGYPSQRFSDKAGIYYGAEYRMIPEWNPFNNWTWLQQYVGVQWIQFVPFVEAGRVAPAWSFSELNSALKWDAGFGFRAMAKGLVVRIDLAGSSEGGSVAMMVSQPYQF